MFEIVVFILVLSVLVISHEFGHFYAAKKSGMRVDEFGFGFPPRLFSFQKGETLYSINAIPFGGFVKIYGEDSESGDSDPRLFTKKPLTLQAIVVAAGVIFNFLLAWALFTLIFLIGFPSSIDSSIPPERVIEAPSPMVSSVTPLSPAHKAGLAEGDRILSIIIGKKEYYTKKSEDIVSIVRNAGEKEILLRIEKGDDERLVSLVPQKGIIEGGVAIGVGLDDIGLVRLPPHEAFFEGLFHTGRLIGATTTGTFGLIHDALLGDAELKTVSGPIGIYTFVGKAQALGFSYLVAFTALISVSLGVLNLVPFPALDGGRLLFILIEAVKGSPIKPQVVQGANFVGFAILVFLMIVISLGDLSKLGLFGGA